MNRCSTPCTRLLTAVTIVVLAALATFHTPAWANRRFPPRVERGVIKFVSGSEVLINGQPVKLAHRIRVFDQRNAMVRPSRLQGLTAKVNFLRDNTGREVRVVWLLTDHEEAKAPRIDPYRLMPAPINSPLDTEALYTH